MPLCLCASVSSVSNAASHRLSNLEDHDLIRAGMTPHPDECTDTRLSAMGYGPEAIERVHALAGGPLQLTGDVGRLLDNFAYEHDWAQDYQIRSARASLLLPRIMCVNAAILAYALLEAFPHVQRRLIALHRRGPDGVECGHVVTAYWNPGGRIGAFSKSNYAALAHRPQTFVSLDAIALSYAKGYVSMGFTPLYYGFPQLDDMGADWRLSDAPLTALLERFTEAYEYAFDLEPAKGKT